MPCTVPWLRICLLALYLVVAGPTRAESGPGCDFSAALVDFEALRGQEGLPGGAVLLGRRDGMLLAHYTGSYNEQTRVAIASASKLLSAVRVLQLADQGRVDLEAPIGALLPVFSGDKAGMRLRQLFAHTSGYGNDSGAEEITDRSTTLAEAVGRIACCRDFPPGFSVGGQFAYGGVSMHIGGRVVEVASGEDWELGWQRALGAPLGIDSIDWQAFGPTRNYMIAGGARSTAGDYAALLHLLLNEGRNAQGQRLLSRAAVRSLWQDQVGMLPVIDPPPTAGSEVRYGLGSWIEPGREPDRPPLIHSLGAFGFMPWVDFEAGLFGVFMLRGLPGINLSAFPVYTRMLVALRTAAAAPGCGAYERFPALFGDGFEADAALIAP
jgi:CubicO group peptidase (beta-lactamase class C family)